MRIAALVLTVAPLPLAAQEAMSWACTPEGGAAFAVSLWDASSGDAPLHCVQAPELEGLDPCAPQGGWGLTDPAAAGEALEVTSDPAVAGPHPDGKVFAFAGPSEFVASASRGVGVPLTLEVDERTFWRMQVTLETGEGVVETADGTVAVRCVAP